MKLPVYFRSSGLSGGFDRRHAVCLHITDVCGVIAQLAKNTISHSILGANGDGGRTNIEQNRSDFSFYTSEHNDGHEGSVCRNGEYTPGDVHSPTGKELWGKWKFEYTGNARVPCWIVRVPKDIVWGHGGLWNDNSVAMLVALLRIQFSLAGGKLTTPKPITAPKTPELEQLNRDKHASQ